MTAYERLWTNLDEFRYVERTEEGYNSTNPNVGDTDGDGLSDGEEYFGFFYEVQIYGAIILCN